MTSPAANGVTTEIYELTNFLVSNGFVDDQNYPIQRDVTPNVREIIFSASFQMSTSLKNVTYAESYRDQLAARAYNFRMLDGALIQMTYRFERGTILQGRLAFLPSPDLESFQNDPALYAEDVIFAEVVSKRI